MAVAAGLMLAPVAMAQGDPVKCEAAEEAAKTVEFYGLKPIAGAIEAPGFVYRVDGPNCRIMTFYRMPANPTRPSTRAEIRELRKPPLAERVAPPFFAARYIDDRKQAPFQPQWTDQSRCKDLVPLLERLEAVLVPRITGDGPYRYALSGVTDQPVIRFWMSSVVYPQDDPGFTMIYTLDGGHASPFGSWLFEAFDSLTPCWSNIAPEVP